MGRGGVVLRKRHDVRGASGRAGRPRGNPRRIQRLRLSHPTRLRSTTFASSTRIVRADSGSPQDPVARTRHLSGDHGKSLAPSGRTQPLIQAHKVQSRCIVPRCNQCRCQLQTVRGSQRMHPQETFRRATDHF